MRPTLLAGLTACLTVFACTTEEQPKLGDESGTDESGETGEPQAPTPNPFAEVALLGLGDYIGTIEPSETIEDGASTHYKFDRADGPMCLRGGEYWMSVRDGSHDPADLVIYLQGGGACWSDLCQAFDSLGTPAVPDSGLLNRDLAGNAFADWNVAYLPYCDGSLFAGDIDIDEDADDVADRFHRGLINLSAGLDVAHDRFPDAERIVLAGASAGGYGVHIANMLVRTLWSEAEIIVVADCGVGLGKPGDFEFIPALLAEWNIARLLPDDCVDCVTDHITGLPRWQLNKDQNMRFAAIAAYDDAIIGGVFLGLEDGQLRAAIETELDELATAHPGRYHRFLFDSTLHTTIGADSVSGTAVPGLTATYDETVVDGTSVAEWLGMLVAGDPGFGDRIE